jgi:hypothetical protein
MSDYLTRQLQSRANISVELNVARDVIQSRTVTFCLVFSGQLGRPSGRRRQPAWLAGAGLNVAAKTWK